MSLNLQPRKVIVLATEQEIALSWAAQLIHDFPKQQVLKNPADIDGILGKENSAIIYNLYEGFNPDVLGAIGGTIIAGGILILITPPWVEWPNFNDPFNKRIANWPSDGSDLSGYYIQRFINKLEQTDCVTIVSKEAELPLLTPPVIIYRADDFKTTDQAQAIHQLLVALKSSEPTTFVLEADRGRGKSAVLGIVSKKLASTQKTIWVTAPSRKTADVIFRHAGKSPLTFIAPDQLCHELPVADILLVDEAAAIPVPLLTKMLKHYPNVIFSTTVQGYEGTGRGFALRFTQQLNSITPHWQKLELLQPIRYAENDPLEAFLFDSLLLNVKPVATLELDSFDIAGCHYQEISAATLIHDEAKLRHIFGLLVLAHYQTRPVDLRHLLDGKNISIHLITWHQQVVAVALCVQEGGFDKELAHDIHYGKRRPRGHLVPQSLAVHAGIADAPLYRTQRVMRIVVHPAIQKQSVASLLLQTIEEQASTDYLSCSFGATAGLLTFWKKQGFHATRLGLSRDASSGCHSVIMIKPLTQQGSVLCNKARQQFQRYFPILLSEPLVDLEKELIQILSDTTSIKEPSKINGQDQQDIDSFAWGYRGYENCMLALQKLTRNSMANPPLWEQLSHTDQTLLHEKVIKQTSWTELAKLTKSSGKKQMLKKLRVIIQHIVELSL